MNGNEIDYNQFPELEGLDIAGFGSADDTTSAEAVQNDIPSLESSITNAATNDVSTEAFAPSAPIIEPVVPAAVAQVQTTPIDNSKQILTDIFGEDLDTTAAKERLRVLKEENERLTALATGSSQSNNVNEKAARFNTFIAETGSDDFSLFEQLEKVSEASDPIDILLMERRLSSKGNWTPQLEQALRDSLVQRYKQDSDVYSESEVALGKYELQDALAGSIEKISSIKGKLDASKPVNILEIYNKSKEVWHPHIERLKALPDASKVNLNFTGMGDQKFNVGGKQIEVPVVYDIPKPHVDRLMNEALELAARNGLQYDEKTSQGIIEYVRGRAIQDNFNEIVSKAIQVAIERVNEVRDAQIHNPSALNPAYVGDKSGQVVQSQEEDITDMILRMEGM